MPQIDGFGIYSYRSFGKEMQYVGPLGKINLVIGQNNSGKSNILRFAAHHLDNLMTSALTGNRRGTFADIDHHISAESRQFKAAFGLTVDGPLHAGLKDRLCEKGASAEVAASLGKVLMSNQLNRTGEIAWFIYESDQRGVFKLSSELVTSVRQVLVHHEWANLWSALTGYRSGSLDDWIPGALHAMSPVQFPAPTISLIPAIREVKKAKEALDVSGAGLIDKLAQLQNPGYNEQSLKKEFEKINHFLRQVTGSEAATIEIPANRDTILVHLNGRTLPLESLGTGIHEVLILAATATVVSGQLICIEEPEIHLHPLLQRKLLDHLNDATENQYLIATHSGHILDVRGVNVFHVQLRNDRSIVGRAVAPAEKFNICIDLGYRSSDLLQANCIIWVEGPSDRIYMRHWLSRVAPDLIEGIHFSLMFYGGRLLSHLTANDPEIEEFISLRRLNRFISILIDSDRAVPRQHLTATKMRIREEFSKGPGFAWITAGREIENYVPARILEQAIREVHKNVVNVPDPGQFGESLIYFVSKGSRKEADKVKVACRAVKDNLPLDVLDLRQKLDKMVGFIRNANGA